jgi:hypothetical protein
MMSDQHRRNGILYGGPVFLLLVLPIYSLLLSGSFVQGLTYVITDNAPAFTPPNIPFTLENLPTLFVAATSGWVALLPLWLLFACTQNDGIFATTQRYRMWSLSIMLPLWLLSTAAFLEPFLKTL